MDFLNPRKDCWISIDVQLDALVDEVGKLVNHFRQQRVRVTPQRTLRHLERLAAHVKEDKRLESVRCVRIVLWHCDGNAQSPR